MSTPPSSTPPTSGSRCAGPYITASAHRPRAGIDPIFSASDALAVFTGLLASPLRPETHVMFIESSGCGCSLATVRGTDAPHMVVDVADTMAAAAAGRAHISGLVLASVRPGGGVLADDDTLWFEVEDTLDACGLVLVDWLIVGRGGTRSMCDELGVPSRWPSRT